MQKLISEGGIKLVGEIDISGSKNAGLAIMAGALLCDKPIVLKNLPNIQDIKSMTALMTNIGCNIEHNLERKTTYMDCSKITKKVAEYDYVKKMRASVLLLGALLGRFGEAKVSLPGGCAIGVRAVDIHIDGMKALGAEVSVEHGYIVAKATRKLVGCEFTLSFPSVGATENIINCAVFAEGKTTLKNVAKEPEIIALCDFLNAIGAKITGQGTDTIVIDGVNELTGGEFFVPEDRIEAGTYAIASAITDGKILLKNCSLKTFKCVNNVFDEIGIGLNEEIDNNGKIIGVNSYKKHDFKPYNIETQVYPGFPTDLQAQTMIPLIIANGTSVVIENLFENRFMHIAELCRMGADIVIEGNKAIIHGGTKLSGANVMATDLRASASLVIASFIADGTTSIDRIYHLDRGYEKIDEKLNNCGAKIRRVNN